MDDIVKEEAPALIERIQSCLNKGMLCEAQALAQKAKALFPASVRITQLLALALARLGATEKARTYLTALYQQDKANAETAGLLGRVYKDLWKKTGDMDFARQSRDTYLDGFAATRHYYPGINAATMSLVLGESGRAKEIAHDVIRICEAGPRDYWSLATLGEAYLIAGTADKASAYYREAVTLAQGRYGDVNSSYQQLCLLHPYIAVPPALFDILKPPGIVAFTGHMIDQPERPEPRFPEGLVEPVKAALGKALDALDAKIGYASAACGADILFIEAMLERGGEVNVILPFRQEDFIQTSVGFAGRHWIDRFHRALEQASAVKYVTEEGYFGNDDLFAFAGTFIQGLCILRAKSMHTAPTLLALWDRKERERNQGGTADCLTYWPTPDTIKIVDLPPARSATLPPQAASSGSIPEPSKAHVPFGIDRTLKCILFADIMGFSKLQEEHTPYFMYEFLQAFSEKLKTFDPQPEVLNTWGDAVFAVYDDTIHMIEFAFALRDMIRHIDWGAKDFPAEMDIRIALHAGPVFAGMDPILARPNSYGAHINRTARMEPVTVPGCIYASEQFAAMLTVAAKDRYACDYVGVLSLPKDFGQQETYHVRRKDQVQ